MPGSLPLPVPKIGLILLRAEWFDSVVALPELVEAVQAGTHTILDFLSPHFELSGIWVINSSQSLQAVINGLKEADVDLFVLAFQVWAEDFYLQPLVRAIGDQPLAVWCYQPWQRLPQKLSFIDVLRGSGPVGTLEGLGTLRNFGAQFFFTQGAPGDPRLLKELITWSRAAQVRGALRKARFGLLPSRNEQMQSTFVDEFRLLADLGPKVQYLSVGELQRSMAALPETDVQDYLAHLRMTYPIQGVSEPTLELAARASLGLAHLAAGRGLDLLSLDDISPELHQELGLRPCLYPPLLDEKNISLSLEGDLGAATALFLLQRLTGSPVLFVEIWFWDEQENIVVGGHAGPQNPAIALSGQAWISHDYEFFQSDRTEGAHLQFVARPGWVTLLQLRGTPGGWQAIVVRGESVAQEPRLEGYPHAVIRLEAPLDRFLRRVACAGSTQHWIMAYGDAAGSIQAFCELAGIPLEVIQ